MGSFIQACSTTGGRASLPARPHDEGAIAVDDVAVVLGRYELRRLVGLEVEMLELAVASRARDPVVVAPLLGRALLPAGVAEGLLPGIEPRDRRGGAGAQRRG